MKGTALYKYQTVNVVNVICMLSKHCLFGYPDQPVTATIAQATQGWGVYVFFWPMANRECLNAIQIILLLQKGQTKNIIIGSIWPTQYTLYPDIEHCSSFLGKVNTFDSVIILFLVRYRFPFSCILYLLDSWLDWQCRIEFLDYISIIVENIYIFYISITGFPISVIQKKKLHPQMNTLLGRSWCASQIDVVQLPILGKCTDGSIPHTERHALLASHRWGY